MFLLCISCQSTISLKLKSVVQTEQTLHLKTITTISIITNAATAEYMVAPKNLLQAVSKLAVLQVPATA